MGDVAIPKTIRIRNTDSEMDSVRVFLEENLKLDSREKEMTCLLICEEMITRLLQSGNDEVTVAVKGLLFPRIVLISQHPMDDGQDLMKKSENERIETEIRRDILKQYEAYIDQEQSANQTVYSIHSVRKNGDSFKEDILRFYNRDGQNGKRKPTDLLRGEIRFEDVTFRYSPEQPPALSKVNLHVPAGKSVAYVGRSGSGKSTALSLLVGLHSPQEGRITIDGMDLDTLDKTRFRRHIAVVPQTSVLFSGTLWENLVYGLKYVSVDRVMEALRDVGLEELVTGHPDGLLRPIYEGGENLSGGQRQRISIARALLRDPGIILLDEATSALDSESEREVQAAIESIMGKCTIIMVAHRLNTIRKADVIYRFEDGLVTRCDSLNAETPTSDSSVTDSMITFTTEQ